MKFVSVPALGPDPWHVAVAVIAAVIVLATAFWLLGPLRRRSGQDCRWRRKVKCDRGRLSAWECKSCGVIGYSAKRGRPSICRRGSVPNSL